MNEFITWPVVVVVSLTTMACVALGIFAPLNVSELVIPILATLALNSSIQLIRQEHTDSKVDKAIHVVSVVQDQVSTVQDQVSIVQNKVSDVQIQSNDNGGSIAAVHTLVNARDTAREVDLKEQRVMIDALRRELAQMRTIYDRQSETLHVERASAADALAAAVAAPAAVTVSVAPQAETLDRRTESERGE